MIVVKWVTVGAKVGRTVLLTLLGSPRLLSDGGLAHSCVQRLAAACQLVAARRVAASLFQVSQAAAELQQYCIQNACKDALLVGVPAGSNPFREPRSCALL
uniref:Guanine nucleotide-binding protein subunit gamma n=2 Tax=Hystricomorpha TaxID=33550 RepID=A0A286Y126_CAVPO